jgi:hypothetical protein
VQSLVWQHPLLYRRSLKLALAVVLVMGVYSAYRQTPSTLGWKMPSFGALELTPALTAIEPIDGNDQQAQAGVGLLPPYGGPIDTPDAKSIARRMSDARFGTGHWAALEKLWMRESGWNPHARNSRSGACGIPQALPCQKIKDMSVPGQIEWGIGYIADRYGNPTNAWRHFLSHGWY